MLESTDSLLSKVGFLGGQTSPPVLTRAGQKDTERVPSGAPGGRPDKGLLRCVLLQQEILNRSASAQGGGAVQGWGSLQEGI